ncbi:hypothetical protein [Thermocrinis minervae]|uniref:Uncharacterized protein n=1 Tax=Thermocrinis minervae TaxID=381751 RepID=A0A1M6RF16_9AQUI|nr:hypothetical protein [Thermocrinis minervae]SHK30978.1 hypothetical protein SAMN05444391_0621 [Thermocrinis minervae]
MKGFTQAGKDKGDLEKELENLIVSIKTTIRMYSASIEDLTEEELRCDLEEYQRQYKEQVKPIVDRAFLTRNEKLMKMAKEYENLHLKLIELIKQRLDTF